MNFFKTLAETNITDVIIQFSQDEEGQATIFVAPKSISQNNPLKSLNPIFISGSPEQIDGEFFLTLANHLVLAKEEAEKVLSKAKQIKSLSNATIKQEKKNDIYNRVKAMTEKQIEEEEKESDEILKAEHEAALKTDEVQESAEKETKPKATKINNEKVLKDFVSSIKDDDILIHQEKIESLISNLSKDELNKPFAKKVSNDIEIAVRKKELIEEEEEEEGFIVDSKPITSKEDFLKNKDVPEFQTPPIGITKEESEKMVNNLTGERTATMEVVKESPNADTVPDPEKEQGIPTETPTVSELKFEPVHEQVEEFTMIYTDHSLEEMLGVGWTKEQLIEHGYAEIKIVSKFVTSK